MITISNNDGVCFQKQVYGFRSPGVWLRLHQGDAPKVLCWRGTVGPQGWIVGPGLEWRSLVRQVGITQWCFAGAGGGTLFYSLF